MGLEKMGERLTLVHADHDAVQGECVHARVNEPEVALHTLLITMTKVVQERLEALVKPGERRIRSGKGGPNAAVTEDGPNGDFVLVEVPVAGAKSRSPWGAKQEGRQMLDGVKVRVPLGRVLGSCEEVMVHSVAVMRHTGRRLLMKFAEAGFK